MYGGAAVNNSNSYQYGSVDAPRLGSMDASSPNLSNRIHGLNNSMQQQPGPSYGKFNPNANQGMGTPTPATPIGMNNDGGTPGIKQTPSTNGLIRLTLKKPMGIVFEPMEDPHNPSQQRGVRICDLPRTGAAALSGMLQVGDELLSINHKPMSRLTFDDIMDFIIEADAENVDLLFRRPKKEKGRSTDGDAKASAVKWDVNVAPSHTTNDEGTVDDTVDDSPKRRGKHPSPGRRRPDNRDEESMYSGDETFYTEQTDYTEDTRPNRRRGRRNRKYASESFLDMLIDTVCAPMLGGGGDDSDDDMTYNSMDDQTYDSRETDYLEQKKKKWQESRKKNTERLKKSVEDEKRRKKAQMKSSRREDNRRAPVSFDAPPPPQINSGDDFPRSNAIPYSEPETPEILSMDNDDAMNEEGMVNRLPPSPRRQGSGSPRRTSPSRRVGGGSPQRYQSPSRRGNSSPSKSTSPRKGPSSRFDPTGMDNNENIEPPLNVPFTEITYDDQVEEQVSVMESVGGPSLLLENLRSAAQMKRTVPDDMVERYGKDFKPELGLTRDESIQMNPDKFYRHAVKKLLQENEPEKLRLVEKLFDKYKGREQHLIRKLDARYAANKPEVEETKSEEKGKSESTDDEQYDGFRAFGGGGFSHSSSGDHGQSTTDASDAWAPQNMHQFQSSNDRGDMSRGDQDDHSEFSGSEDYDSIDGTSPEVIAQVSELLNYVYGKTTVAGQIDRVSTIMRAYEGREAILLELLETKALLKANNDKGNLEDLPESLRNNPALEVNPSGSEIDVHHIHAKPAMSPVSHMTPATNEASTMQSQRSPQRSTQQQYPMHDKEEDNVNPFDIDQDQEQAVGKKKKKGLFRGMFKKKDKNKKNSGGAFPTGKKGDALLNA